MASRGRTLMVDDEANARAALSEILHDEGYVTETAADGFKALGKLEDFAAALKELVAFAQSCPELRFDITGHTSKEGAADKNQKLSAQRATSVKKTLVAAGVPEAAGGKVTGAGSTQPAIPEPEAYSDDAKKLGPEKLEAIRNVNRRITFTVTTHCP